MKMEAKKKSTLRWIGEAALVFLSVIGAFWVEKFREQNQAHNDYVETLLAFRDEVHNQVRELRQTQDTYFHNHILKINGKPLLIERDSVLSIADSLIRTTSNKNFESSLNIIIAAYPFADWRHETVYASTLQNYPSLLISDNLEPLLKIYTNTMKFEYSEMERYRYTYNKLSEDISYDINYSEEIKLTQAQIDKYMVYFRNAIFELKTNLYYQRQTDSLYAIGLSNIVTELDIILAKHGRDTSKLQKMYLIKH